MGPAPTPVPNESFTSLAQRFVTAGTLIKTVIGLIVASVVAVLAVYNHFAKTYELAALSCKVVEQNNINNEMIGQTREIQSALKMLKESFDSTADKPISAKFVANEISNAVAKIEKSLNNITDIRKTGQNKEILKDGKC